MADADIHEVFFHMEEETLLASGSIDVVSPVDGVVNELIVNILSGVETGGEVIARANGSPIPGLSLLVPDNALAAAIYTADTESKSKVRTVSQGDIIKVRATGFAGRGSLTGYVYIEAGATLA